LLNKVDFRESFSYCIPHIYGGNNDYDYLKPERHIAFAKECIGILSETIMENDVSSKDMEKLADISRRLYLVAAGKFEKAVDGLEFMRDYRSLYSEFDTDNMSAGPANCLSDVARYML
jgi:hypothetical protein